MDGSGVTLADGGRVESATVIWAAGMHAAPLTEQIHTARDNLGRLLVDRELRVPSVPGVFATGDAAKAATDDVGNFALLSCQHAMRMGAFAGNNAAAELLGVPTRPYHQEVYCMGGTRLRLGGRLTGTAPVVVWAEIRRFPHDVPTMTGISGGPMLDAQGKVVGIVVATSVRRGRAITIAPQILRAVEARLGPREKEESVPAHEAVAQPVSLDKSARALSHSARIAQTYCIPG